MKDFKTLVRMIREIYEILSGKQRKGFCSALIAIVVGSLFELLGVTAILPFVQALVSPELIMSNTYIKIMTKVFNIDNAQQALYMIGIGIILIYLIKNVYLIFSAYVQVRYCNNVNQSLSVLMLKSYMERPYEFFVNTNTGDILRGTTSDVDGVCSVIELLFKFASEGLVTLLLVIYLIIADTTMALGVMFAGIITMMVVVIGVKRNMSTMGKLNRQASAENYKNAMQAIGGIKDIFVYDKKTYFINEYEKSYDNKRISTIHYKTVSALPERVIEAFCISGIIATVLIKLNNGVDAKSFVPFMGVFAVAAFRMLPSISRITGYIATLIYFRSTLDNAYENIMYAKKSQHYRLSTKTGDSAKIKSFNEELIVDSIEWKYENSTDKVLRNLSMYVKKGESVGIVGESGSGKSTLSDILLRLYKPKSGKITVDGNDVYTIDNEWCGIVGYVPQTVFLLDDTIRRNIAFGELEIDDEKIWKVLEQAQLRDYVAGLPEGIDTIVGERGIKFSGGQRQRIAIARALYFEPQILILDEATSALDNDTEAAVMDAVEELHGKMTMIIIAHRLTTIEKCDRVYEICNGTAVERKIDELCK